MNQSNIRFWIIDFDFFLLLPLEDPTPVRKFLKMVKIEKGLGTSAKQQKIRIWKVFRFFRFFAPPPQGGHTLPESAPPLQNLSRGENKGSIVLWYRFFVSIVMYRDVVTSWQIRSQFIGLLTTYLNPAIYFGIYPTDISHGPCTSLPENCRLRSLGWARCWEPGTLPSLLALSWLWL